ncbi:peroxiredoxin [Rickettsiales bacterium]|nr:peroxiredoxin [Rickettsiales bacterium]
MGLSLVQKPAPDFKANTVLSDNRIKQINLSEFQGRFVVLFFYPLDFTFVCPTELIAINNRLNDFEKIDTTVMGVSVDSQHSHLAWKNTPVNKGGIGNIKFPLVSDLDKSISSSYGILTDQGISLRGTFVINAKGIVRYQSINDLEIGRNIDELLRTIRAIKHSEEHGNVCPAGWSGANDSMKATPEGVVDYLVSHADSI